MESQSAFELIQTRLQRLLKVQAAADEIALLVEVLADQVGPADVAPLLRVKLRQQIARLRRHGDAAPDRFVGHATPPAKQPFRLSQRAMVKHGKDYRLGLFFLQGHC